jgi:hypothetical protein
MSQELEACRDGIDSLKSTLLQNQAISDRNKIKVDEYNARQSAWKNQHNQWQINTSNWNNNFNNYQAQQRGHRRDWKNCVDGINCNYRHDDWCVKDHGGDYVDAFGECYQSDCGLYRRGKCKYSDDALNRQFAQYPVSNPRPIEPTLAPMDTLEQLIPITGIAINCCANISNVINSDLKNVTIDQLNECINTINITTPPPTTTPSSVSTTPSSVSTTPSSVSTTPSSVSTTPSSVSTTPSFVSTTPSSVSTAPSFVSTIQAPTTMPTPIVSSKLNIDSNTSLLLLIICIILFMSSISSVLGVVVIS